MLYGNSSRFDCYPPRKADCSRVTHPSATKSRIPSPISKRLGRLACVRRAASVHPEPGSNSLKIVLERVKLCFNNILESDVSLILTGVVTSSDLPRVKKLLRNFRFALTTFVLLWNKKFGAHRCLIYKGTICCFQRVFPNFSLFLTAHQQLFSISKPEAFVKNFFKFFFFERIKPF